MASAAGPGFPENNSFGAVAGLDRLISELIDPVECGAKLGAPGFEGSDLLLERVKLALRGHAEGGKLIAARLQLCLQFAPFAVEGPAKLGQLPFTRRQFRRAIVAFALQITAKLVAFFATRLQRRLKCFTLLVEHRAKPSQGFFVRRRFGCAFLAFPAQGIAQRG